MPWIVVVLKIFAFECVVVANRHANHNANRRCSFVSKMFKASLQTNIKLGLDVKRIGMYICWLHSCRVPRKLRRALYQNREVEK